MVAFVEFAIAQQFAALKGISKLVVQTFPLLVAHEIAVFCFRDGRVPCVVLHTRLGQACGPDINVFIRKVPAEMMHGEHSLVQANAQESETTRCLLSFHTLFPYPQKLGYWI